MLLGRLRVRQKLTVLVLPLLLLVIVAIVPTVASRVQAAQRSGDAAEVVERAVRIGALVQEVQQERLASLGYLSGDVGRDRVVARTQRVLELTDQLRTDYAGGDPPLAVVLRGIQETAGLGQLRDRVLARTTSGIEVYQQFTEVTDGLVAQLRLLDTADLTSTTGRQQVALESIIRHDEATVAAGAALFTEPGRRVTARVLGLVSANQAIQGREEQTFTDLARPDTVELYEQVERGQSSSALGSYLDGLTGRLDQQVPVDLLPRVGTLTSLSRLVETRVAAQAVDEAERSANQDGWLTVLGVILALLLLVGAAVLALSVSRSIARPLRRLTESADEVADVAQQELVRVADTDDPEAAVPRLRPVRVGTTDELGELAQAFNRVQQVAADLVERQLVSRQNVATMFGNVGRRTQNLVGRQLAMIDSLERNEQDPALLDRLYRLDHVSTRLRRNANSLVVLSGALDQQINGEPLSVADTIRSALGEIEGFQRVRLGQVDEAVLTPNVTPDIILLLAELLENGTSFSPPHTEVEVDAQAIAGGDVVIRIVDHGLGMTTEQLAAENGRLVSRERLDLAPTDVLGLFVVGRLARRHGIEVLLAPTPGTGVTAEVRVPVRHVVRTEQPATAAAGDAGGRGWWEPGSRSGSMPGGSASVGTAPMGSVPRGSAPVGSAPGGSGPVGSAPMGSGAGGSGPVSWAGAPAPGEDHPDAVGRPDGAERGEGRDSDAGRDSRPGAVRVAGTAPDADLDGPPVPTGATRARIAAVPNGDTGRDGAGPSEGAGRRDGADRRDGAGSRDDAGAPDRGGPRDGVTPLRALAGIVRRVRGAQLPDTGTPRRPEPEPVRPSAEESRQAVEDFEAGVRRALRDTGADGAALSTDEPPAPWSALDPADEAGAAGTRALVEEFEDGVRRALARLDEVAARPAPGPAALFDRRAGAIPVPRRSTDRTRAASTGPTPLFPRTAPADPAPDAVDGPLTPASDRTPAPEPAEPTPVPEVVPTAEPAPVAEADVAPLERRRRGAAEARTRDAGPGTPETARRIGTNGLPDRRRAVDPGPSGPAGLADLVRRVPGAQFPAGARAAVPGPPQPSEPAAEQDAAAAARAFVEEFEAGVERALRDGGDRRTAETDEEDAR